MFKHYSKNDVAMIALCSILGSYSGGFKEFCHLEYSTLYIIERQLTFRMNMPPLIFCVEE
jgi:hypothetical protein